MFFKTTKYITVTLYDPTNSIVGFTRSNKLPVTIEEGKKVQDVLIQFNKFRAPTNQIKTNISLNTKVYKDMEILIN